MGYARIVVAGATTALTRRTAFRKMFAAPSSPMVRQGYLFALGMAQAKTGVLVHHGTLLPNHSHLTVTPTEANLPEFVRRLNREASCFLKAYLSQRGYEAPANVWDDRDPHCMRLVGAGAMLAWLVYEHVNCVAAGLVRDVAEYPGWVSDFGAMKHSVIVVDKPNLYFGRRCPRQIELTLSPPPLLTQVYSGDIDKLVYDLEVMARSYQRQVRRQMGPALGPDAVKRLQPWAEPRTPREPRGLRVPQFKVGGGDDARPLRRRCAMEQRAFRQRYAEDRRRYREGDTSVVFPYGTYGMRLTHGVRVEDAPPSDAILAAPGPLPDDPPERAWTSADRRQVATDAESWLSTDGADPKDASVDQHGPGDSASAAVPGEQTPARVGLAHAQPSRSVTKRGRPPGDPDPAPS